MIPRFSPDYHWSSLPQVFSIPRRDAIFQLEIEMARRSQHEAAIFFRYGRSGLYFLLQALGYKNRKVIMPAYTCVVVAHAVVLSGNIPVFLDNREGLQPAPADYLAALSPEVGMVIPTHLFGIAEDFAETARAIKRTRPDIFILQDCAHSFFCQDAQGDPVTRHGDGALFGMNISKLVNSVKGGCLTLRDRKLGDEVRKQLWSAGECHGGRWSLRARAYYLASALAFSQPGYEIVSWLSKQTKLLDSETKYFRPEQINLPLDFANPPELFNAEIGLQSLRQFTGRVAARAEIAKYYTEICAPLVGKVIEYLPQFSEGHTWSHFPVLLKIQARDAARHTLQRQTRCEVGTIVDYSIPDLSAYRERGYARCPRASLAAQRVVNLPLTLREGLSPVRDWKRLVRQVGDTLRSLSEPGSQVEPATCLVHE